MARGRLISKSLGSSRKFHAVLKAGGRVGEFCQVLFPLIVANTDDFGRLPGDAFTVKAVVFPVSPRPERDFDRALDALSDVALIDRYAVNGDIFIQVNDFDAHQVNLHKRMASKFPESPGISGKFRTNLIELNLRESNLRESNSTATRVAVVSDGFPQFWAAYPKKKAKDDALRAWAKRQPDAALLQVILASLHEQCQSPEWRRERGRYIPFPATWLNRGQWTDSPAPDESVAPNYEWECPHTPHCAHRAACAVVAMRNTG